MGRGITEQAAREDEASRPVLAGMEPRPSEAAAQPGEAVDVAGPRPSALDGTALTLNGASPLSRYVVAAVVTGAAFVLRMELSRYFGPPYILFYPAVMLSALLGGLGPGLLATATSALLAVIWILPVERRFLPMTTRDAASLVVFTMVGLFASVIAGRYRHAKNRLIAYEKARAVRDSEERFKAFFDNPAVGAKLLDLDGRFQQVNDRYCQITGYGRDELLRMTPVDLCLPEDRERERDHLMHYLQGKERGFDTEKRYLRKDGTVVWVHVTAGIIRDALGRPIRSGGVIEDITDRKRVQEALQRSETLLRAITENSPDPIFLKDLDSRMLLANPATLKTLGKSAEAVIGRTHLEVFGDPEISRALIENDQRVIQSGQTQVVEETVRTITGRRVFLTTKSPYRDDTGRVVGVIGVARDITERKAAQDALRHSEQRVRLKLESILSPTGEIGNLDLADIIDAQAVQSLMDDFYKLARVPMAVIGLEGRVLVGVGWQEICAKFHRVHPQTCKHCVESDTQLTLGVPAGEFRLYKCKNNMWDIATPLSVGGHHVGNVFMGQFFFSDERVDYEVFRSQAKEYGFDEQEYLAALDAVPRLSREAVAAGMAFFLRLTDMLSQLSYSNIKLARSVTEREALTASLRQSNERLEEADRRKSEFLAVLSHELRNPLAPIRNSLYLLDRAPPGTDQAARATAVIGRQVSHLARLVDDLLDVTRISHGKIVLSRSYVDARDVVRKTCEDHRTIFDQRGVELRVDNPAGPVWIDADAARISQVLGNLLQNAAKFTPERGATAVAVAAVGGRAQIRVRDDGIGIEPELLGHIFEPFTQAERSLARTQGGLGLGLALVKGLVELHGGSVGALSEGVNRGSEFIIWLPLAIDPDVARPGPRTPRLVDDPLLILVIEDHLDSGQTLAEVLSLRGHRVRVATDGRSGIAKARDLKPDVVLCDIGLPDVDGYEVARTLRRDDALRSTRLIALSGYAQAEDRQRALVAGFDAHVGKPVPLDELGELLSTGKKPVH